MSDVVPTPTEPTAGHNQPTARGYLADMRHAATLYLSHLDGAESHLLAVMENAYRLRWYGEESAEHKDELVALLKDKGIADTKRSKPFTRLLNLAFHKDQLDEPARISRCAAALQVAWDQNPRIPPDDVVAFIDKSGGIVSCGRKGRGAGNRGDPPPAIPIPGDLKIDLKGHKSIAGRLEKDDKGKWQFYPSHVLSQVKQPGRSPKPPD
jgi:hypothetical protein